MKFGFRMAAISAGVVLLFMLLASWWYLAGEGPRPERQGVVRITVARGATAWRVAHQLAREGLVQQPRRFVWYLKARGKSEALKAGTYDFPRSHSTREIAERILNGDEVVISITIPEGLRAAHIAGMMQSAQVCDSLEFMRAVGGKSVIDSYGLEVSTLEGFLFPETYSTRLNRPASDVVKEMVQTFVDKMGVDWIEGARRDPLGLRGIVTLASIVQGEIQLSDEAGDVAALYRNRLRQGMKLQADPTIQYLVDGEPRRLTLRDLRIDSPYNTYLYTGLPPGPINNPGKTALSATLNPPERPWIFMVANGKGGHTFTTTYEDHLQAKKRLDAIRRMVDRQKQFRNF